jgi:tetratricopeptide (TPR) repeat protein
LAKKRPGSSARTTRNKSTARKGASPRSTRTTAKTARRSPAKTASRPAKLAKKATPKPSARRNPAVDKPQQVAPTPQPAAPPPPPRKPGFYEAVAIYERGVQALQRHDYPVAAEQFRTVIERYPEERELLERARLYLRVCERETQRQAAPPQSSGDHVYAATVALNSGDHATALGHLQRALTADANNDHAHYIMAAALSLRGRREEALEHLQRSIALNPENRSQARQDPDLENIRSHEGFRAVIESTASTARGPRRR